VRTSARIRSRLACLLSIVLAAARAAAAQPQPDNPALRTPLDTPTMTLLANEVSGQMAFDNLVLLAGAPWQRDPSEFGSTFRETQVLHDLVRTYGVETVRIERYPGSRFIDYPADAAFWVVEPTKRLVARLGADAALVASGSQTADVTGELIYLPPLTDEQVRQWTSAGPPPQYRGKVALMWAHPREDAAKALDAAGIRAVVGFNARDRYLDPGQVVYSGGAYQGRQNLKVGFTISWRQWSELLEDVQAARQPIVVRCQARIVTYPDRFEAVYAWIPGTEPDAAGVIFTAHLFEGYTKRGTNDNMSGVAVQLEILRTLTRLIAAGQLPRPRRTIHFLWPNEISGTYEFIRQHPGIADTLSVNINMDMVGEWLRKNNSVFTMSECPAYLPCFFDGLARSVLNYVWRTNDIVYLPDSPAGRPGGQYFPAPLVEKNGSTDAFRFFIHKATGGSDHVCFNNPSVGVPGIEFFTWPDQWYHADTDTPDKADPTQMKRVAFIGAATALVSADLDDRRLPGLLDAVSAFGYARVAERDLPRALRLLDTATADTLPRAAAFALTIVGAAVDRETGAIRTVEQVATGTAASGALIAGRIDQWRLYRAGLDGLLQGSVRLRAAQLGVALPAGQKPRPQKPVPAAATLEARVPALHPSVKGREFALTGRAEYTKLMQDPDALKTLGVSRPQAAAVLNWVNGRRTIRQIRDALSADTGEEVSLEGVMRYLEFLKAIQWVTL